MSEAKHRKAARRLMSMHGYKAGGHHGGSTGQAAERIAAADVHKHEKMLHPGAKRTKFARGGAACDAEGRAAGGRLDKKGRDGASTANKLHQLPKTKLNEGYEFEANAGMARGGRAHKGKGKGGHNIHIVVATPAQGQTEQQKQMFQAGMAAGAGAAKSAGAGAGGGLHPMPGAGMPPPQMPPAGPPGGPGGPPPSMMPPGAPPRPPGMAAGGPAHEMEEVRFMRRKRGGRSMSPGSAGPVATVKMDGGAGGGLGRLEKTEDAERR